MKVSRCVATIAPTAQRARENRRCTRLAPDDERDWKDNVATFGWDSVFIEAGTEAMLDPSMNNLCHKTSSKAAFLTK
jgi:hypothetical protein